MAASVAFTFVHLVLCMYFHRCRRHVTLQTGTGSLLCIWTPALPLLCQAAYAAMQPIVCSLAVCSHTGRMLYPTAVGLANNIMGILQVVIYVSGNGRQLSDSQGVISIACLCICAEAKRYHF